MIIVLDDILDEVKKEYPEFTRKSIEQIGKRGFSRINMELKNGNEVLLKGHKREEIKLYKPKDPEIQIQDARRKYYVKKKKERDAKRNSDK